MEHGMRTAMQEVSLLLSALVFVILGFDARFGLQKLFKGDLSVSRQLIFVKKFVEIHSIKVVSRFFGVMTRIPVRIVPKKPVLSAQSYYFPKKYRRLTLKKYPSIIVFIYISTCGAQVFAPTAYPHLFDSQPRKSLREISPS